MNSISQDMRFRLSIVKSCNRVGATKTAICYKITRQFVYFWVQRFNGDIHSLADHSHRPIIILISTRILKSNGSRILEEEILIWG